MLFDAVGETVEPDHFPPIQRLGITETHLAAVEVELESDLGDLQAILG